MSANLIDWRSVTTQLAELSTCVESQEQLLQLAPFSDPKLAKQSFDEINAFKKLLLAGLRPTMESLDLFGNWSQRLQKGALLKTLELKDIRFFCLDAMALQETLASVENPIHRQFLQQIFSVEEPLSAIEQLITDEGDIRSDASEELYKLFNEKSQLSKSITQVLDKVVKQNEMDPILQDRYVTNREGRLVVPVKSGMQHNFDGVVHASSQSKQTVFMEPQDVIPLNNKLRQVEVDIEKEVERLLRQISKYLNTKYNHFIETKNVLLTCDQIFAKARQSIQLSSHPCEFVVDKVELYSVRHPGLVLNNEEVIPNTIEMDDQCRILLLSGPNAGGKTVLLKSIGLAAEMARHGLPICAEPNSKLPFFKKIYVAVGDLQSVKENLSTFAGHLKVLNQATDAKGLDQLILVDEVCGATDPEEGTALARSFIEAYAGAHCFAVITSHFSALKAHWADDSGVINGSLEYDSAKDRPTYQFIRGIPGDSLAIQTAERVGVAKSIIERAFEFLSPALKKYRENLLQIQDLRDELQNTRSKLNLELKQTQKERQKYQTELEKFHREKSKLLEQEVRKANEKINTLIDHAKVDHSFKKHEALQKMQSNLPQIIKSKPDNDPTPTSAEEFKNSFPPGTKVYVPMVGRDGIVQAEPNAKGEVMILSESIQLTLPWTQLKPPMVNDQSNKRKFFTRNDQSTYSPRDKDRTVDLRGMNSEEAIDLVQIQLDKALVNQEDRVKIVHGHGTEALKRQVRQHLSRSEYVKTWQAGNKQTGGDGVTWVDLKD